jgi:hypothetical protein
MITHRYERYSFIQVSSSLMLNLDLECERARMISYEKLLEEWGIQFKHTKPYPKKYMNYIGDSRCYDAAMKLAVESGLVYCEGVLLIMSSTGSMYSMGHGWCSTRRGEVVDPILWNHQNNPRVEYLGIPISKEFMVGWVDHVGYTGVLDGYADGRPSPLHQTPAMFWYEGIDCDE